MSMSSVTSNRGVLSSVSVLCLTACLLLPSAAKAQFITNSPDPFQGSQLTLQAPSPVLFTPLGFAQTFTIDNIAETSNTIVAGDDIIAYTAVLNGTFYTTPALTTPTMSISLPGTFEVTLQGRTSPFATGTFNYVVNSESFSGVISGHTLTLQLDPSFVSGGVTTITAGPGVGQFTITAPATVHSERSVDGSPFTPGPAFDLTVGPAPAAVPEPGVMPVAAIAGVGGLLTVMRAKRRN